MIKNELSKYCYPLGNPECWKKKEIPGLMLILRKWKHLLRNEKFHMLQTHLGPVLLALVMILL